MGYTRIQGAQTKVGIAWGRSTIRRIVKAAGLHRVPQRPTSCQTFLKAHWGVITAADFHEGSPDVPSELGSCGARSEFCAQSAGGHGGKGAPFLPEGSPVQVGDATSCFVAKVPA